MVPQTIEVLHTHIHVTASRVPLKVVFAGSFIIGWALGSGALKGKAREIVDKLDSEPITN